jgi:hypothetical protein
VVLWGGSCQCSVVENPLRNDVGKVLILLLWPAKMQSSLSFDVMEEQRVCVFRCKLSKGLISSV